MAGFWYGALSGSVCANKCLPSGMLCMISTLECIGTHLTRPLTVVMAV